MSQTIKTRFAPSPTGELHVGNARTALFSWLMARKAGGRFLLRIEDTDTARNVPGADERIAETLRWMGLDWDEGFGVGGENGPYRQTERLAIYQEKLQSLLDSGNAYHAFETADELEAMREAAQKEKKGFRYPRPATLPTQADADKARAEGRPVVVRFKMPSKAFTVCDLVMGDVTIAADELDDFIIQKADGVPTYHMAVVVDDALMGVTRVVRGQEFLAQTPRHLALQEAMGLATPEYAHLPLIMDMKGRKLSKRDGDVEVQAFRKAGYLPEVLVNFMSLLGWSPSGDREKFTLDELVDAFEVERIGKTSAKFDRDKLLAFNTDACGELDEDRLLAGLKDYIALNDTVLPDDEVVLRALLRANKGFRTYVDIATKARCIFVEDGQIEYDDKAVAKNLTKGDNAGLKVLADIVETLNAVEPWDVATLEQTLNGYCDANDLKLGKVAQPIRVAVSGGSVSPTIYDTLALMGKATVVRRIRKAIELFG